MSWRRDSATVTIAQGSAKAMGGVRGRLWEGMGH